MTFGYRGRPGAITFSPDGKILAAANTDRFGGTDGTITLWEVATGRYIATLQGHTERIPAVAFSPDGATLATALKDGTLKLWAVKTGKHTSILRGRGGWSIAYSPDGTTLASGLANGTVALSKVETGRRFAILRGHSDRITSVAFSPDGTKLAAGAAGFDNSSHGVIKLWEFPPKAWTVLTGRNFKTFDGHTKGVRSVAFSPDSRILASGAADGVKLWEVSTGENIATLQESSTSTVAFSSDGIILAAGSRDGIKLWEVSTEKNIATFPLPDKTVSFPVVFSPDDKTLASGSQDGTALLWKVSELIND